MCWQFFAQFLLMPKGASNLVVDILAVHTKFQAIRHVLHRCLEETLEFIGQRQPRALLRHDHTRCRECRKGGWWQEHVTCRRETTLDPVLRVSYELDECWDIITNNDGKFKQTGINLNDLPGDPSNEIEFRNGRMYGSVEDERIIVYNPSKQGWDTQAIVKDTPSAFDISPLVSGGCRIVYSDNFKPWQVSIIYEDSTERKIGGFVQNTFAVFVTPDVIVADDSNGTDTVTLSLIDVHRDQNAKVVDRVSLTINPDDYLQGLEVSPCGDVIYIETLASARLITVIY